MSFETTTTIYQGHTYVLLKNRRQRHELLRHLSKVYQPLVNERVFHESILKELIQRQTYVTPIYENAMNLLLYITLIHNVPVCFAVPQYSSQYLPFINQKSKYEPFIWSIPIAIPPSWKKTLFSTPQHTIVLQGEFVMANEQSPDKRPILFLERVLFNGNVRDTNATSYHIDYLKPLLTHITRFTYSSLGIRFEMKSYESMRSFDSKRVFDDSVMQNIIGFRMYSLKNPITYYHHLVYKSYKVNELEPYSTCRIRLLQEPITVHTYKEETIELLSEQTVQNVACRPVSADVTIMAVNMRDSRNIYGVYQLYSQSPVKQTAPHILRLETFEQHIELCQYGKKQPTIYLRVWFHPYFNKWCLVDRDFSRNIVQKTV